MNRNSADHGQNQLDDCKRYQPPGSREAPERRHLPASRRWLPERPSGQRPSSRSARRDRRRRAQRPCRALAPAGRGRSWARPRCHGRAGWCGCRSRPHVRTAGSTIGELRPGSGTGWVGGVAEYLKAELAVTCQQQVPVPGSDRRVKLGPAEPLPIRQRRELRQRRPSMPVPVIHRQSSVRASDQLHRGLGALGADRRQPDRVVVQWPEPSLGVAERPGVRDLNPLPAGLREPVVAKHDHALRSPDHESALPSPSMSPSAIVR
jgi:hypothetical protein